MSEQYNQQVHSDFLFASPSFLEGLARIIDFGNLLEKYNTSSSEDAADERAIRADWEAVGNDLYNTIENNRD
jgi:hypothetical protein